MTYLFVCYAKCTTCQKARKFLREKAISFKERDIKTQNPTREELTAWRDMSGLSARKLFNTSGVQYRNLQLAQKLPDMAEEEMLDLLSTDGMLVKRPVLVGGDTVLFGFKAPEWEVLAEK